LVTQKPWANRGQRLIAPRGRDAGRLFEDNLFQFCIPAAPVGDFETGAELGFQLIKRMRKEARQERSALGALEKLG